MEFTHIDVFLEYYGKVRQRTKRLLDIIPDDKMDWTPIQGKFTFADLIRHLAAIERFMYAENVQGKPSRYPACGKELAVGREAVLRFFDQCHEESMAIFATLTPENLSGKCVTPAGTSITTWKWLRLLPEHEIHHRGQIYTYAGFLGIETPPIYGMTSEQVAEASRGSDA
jgi:uncharacterized damage-inducible protein DinB